MARASRRSTVYLVDDHAVVREGLAQLINQSDDLHVAGEASTAREAMRALEAATPGVLVADISMEGDDGLELIKQVKARWVSLPILVLSMHSEEVYAERALRAGAQGYVMKQEASSQVLTAIRRVINGELYVSPTVQARLLQRLVGRSSVQRESAVESLSDRELEVFRLIGLGQTTRQVAATLKLSVKTIESHREHIKKKLHLDSAAQLVQHAAQWVQKER